MEQTFAKYINVNGQLMDLSYPQVMGILNITPDSFYAGSRTQTETEIVERAIRIIQEGGSIIDVGAYSSRPDAEHISPEEETERLRKGLRIIRRVMMHMQGTPQDMQLHPHYENIVKEVLYYFSEKVQKLRDMGAKDLIIDPGFGFGKTLEHNYELLNKMEELQIFGLPVLVGVSRKSMIYKLLDGTPETALNGTSIVNAIALMKGADILRVHDVKAAAEAIRIVAAMKNLKPEE